MINKIENISIIMSVKNGEKFLGKAIESILNQTFINFEFIIVNNDSNDNHEDSEEEDDLDIYKALRKKTTIH